MDKMDSFDTYQFSILDELNKLSAQQQQIDDGFRSQISELQVRTNWHYLGHNEINYKIILFVVLKCENEQLHKELDVLACRVKMYEIQRQDIHKLVQLLRKPSSVQTICDKQEIPVIPIIPVAADLPRSDVAPQENDSAAVITPVQENAGNNKIKSATPALAKDNQREHEAKQDRPLALPAAPIRDTSAVSTKKQDSVEARARANAARRKNVSIPICALFRIGEEKSSTFIQYIVELFLLVYDGNLFHKCVQIHAGKCDRGDRCLQSHDVIPVSYCFEYNNTGRCNAPSCSFQHVLYEINTVPNFLPKSTAYLNSTQRSKIKNMKCYKVINHKAKLSSFSTGNDADEDFGYYGAQPLSRSRDKSAAAIRPSLGRARPSATYSKLTFTFLL